MASKKTTAAKTADEIEDAPVSPVTDPTDQTPEETPDFGTVAQRETRTTPVPSVGRIVHYNPTGKDIGKLRAAIVTDVNEEKDTVDLVVFALNGVGTTFLRNVKLDQPQDRPEDAPEDWKPTPVEHTWAWPARV